MTLDSIMSLKMNSIDNTSKEFIISADNIKIYYYQRNGKRKMYDNSIVSMSNSHNIELFVTSIRNAIIKQDEKQLKELVQIFQTECTR